MQLGFALPQAGHWVTPEAVSRCAVRAEELGYRSLWSHQRLLYAVDPRDAYPPRPRERTWPSTFVSSTDPLILLSHASAVTSAIRLGIAVLNAPFYSPVMLAKQLSTLDLLSGGRLQVGLSIGWSRDEFAAAGVPFTDRGGRLDEFLSALDTAWRAPERGFDGERYRFPPSRIEPRPTQEPRPPILIGGYSEPGLRRAARVGDGWVGGNLPFDRTTRLIERLRELLSAAGREEEPFRVVVRGAVELHERPLGADRRPLTGNADQIQEDICGYARAGVGELFLDVNFDDRVGGIEADVAEAAALTTTVLETFAPGRR